MSELPSELFRQWVHSYEEDTGGVTVYRPTGHPLPPARGRRGMEILPDGTFVDRPIGSRDVPGSVPGRWTARDERTLVVAFPGTDRPGRVLEIVHCDADVLKARVTAAP
ncbi:hypothetical protein [Streptomyces griseocarneus]|uniref:hypothetical protein n=1 Tax=Streptomyces griseocarneus TaxID=51201 RepID=UPI00167D674A|nr:hypothetical protein [Streptomyces griseocarneus]MBZ6477130.1 hypothetical protein [Streptomyces griseocarneus]GHG53722.1 hypothetical protein GCM10018779_15900 [Streptomyces griseocarneus]